MAYPTSVNSQITDAVTEVNTVVLGVAPAVAMGELYVATAQAMANAALNATNQQQQGYALSQAATVVATTRISALAKP